MTLLLALLTTFSVARAGVAERHPFWRPGQTIRIEVHGANSADLSCIKAATEEISTFAHIHFALLEPGQSPRPHVRLDVRRPRPEDTSGGYSHVGNTPLLRERMELALPDLSTVDSPGSCDRQIILHEFGHLLGLKHEHQHPDAPAAIRAQYAAAGNDMDNHNFRRFSRGSAWRYHFSPYDVDSIMHYGFRLDGALVMALIEEGRFTPQSLGSVARGWREVSPPGSLRRFVELCYPGQGDPCPNRMYLELGVASEWVAFYMGGSHSYSVGDKATLARLYPFPGERTE